VAPGGARKQVSTVLALLFFVAVLVRVGVYIADPNPWEGSGLTATQGEIARNIVENGKWFVVNQGALDFVTDEQNASRTLLSFSKVDLTRFDRDAHYKPEVLEMPGLGIVLAGIWWATGDHSYLFVQWLQIALDSAMVLLVYWITLRLARSKPASLLAALSYAIWPGAAVLASRPSLDTWAAFFTIGSVAVFLWALKNEKRTLPLIALGLLVGLSVYFRPFLLALPLALAVTAVVRGSWRERLVLFAVPTVVAATMLAPWSIRNYVEFHKFIPSRIGLGQALWEALGETPNDFGAVKDDVATKRWVHRVRPDLEYGTPDYDDFLLSKARHAIVDHPRHYVGLVLRRSIFLLPCLLLLFVRRGTRREAAMLIGVALVIILPYAFIHMETRYWLPAAFAYLILGSLVAENALSAVRNRRLRQRQPGWSLKSEG
jgi:4-amino-4-deoxy-L-arabinose transferase-like glycosyltransferase